MTRAPCKRWPAPCPGQLASPAAAWPRSLMASCRQPLPSPLTPAQDPGLGEGQEVCPAGRRLGRGRQGASLWGRGPAAGERSQGLILKTPRETQPGKPRSPPGPPLPAGVSWPRSCLPGSLRGPPRPPAPQPRGTGPAASGDKCPLTTKTRSAPFPGARRHHRSPLNFLMVYS